MHGNDNFQPMNSRTKQRNGRPPAGEQQERPKQAKQQRGKQWERGNKRDQWQDFA